jgi:hypothetical protein
VLLTSERASIVAILRLALGSASGIANHASGRPGMRRFAALLRVPYGMATFGIAATRCTFATYIRGERFVEY